MAINIARWKFVAALSGTAIAWSLAAHAQRPAMPQLRLVLMQLVLGCG